MKERKVFYSMIEIEREYYPASFLERKKKVKEGSVEQTEISLAQIAINEVKDELEELGSIC